MGSKWTVTPEVVRHDLQLEGEEFWLDLKKNLTAGEQRRMNASGFRSLSRVERGNEEADVELNVNYDVLGFTKMLTWLADWSLTDEHGKKLTRTIDTLRALRPVMADLIEKTIDEHAKEMGVLAKKSQTTTQSTEQDLRKISS